MSSQTQTQPQDLATSLGITTVAQASEQLPALATETFQEPGDLINSSDFSEEMLAQIVSASEAFDIRDTAQRLRFGADTQRKASAYMDELLGNMRMGEAGAAGEILAAVTSSVDLMRLKEVKNQISNPPSWLRQLFSWVDYIKMFHENHKLVVKKFDDMEKKANNQMAILSEDSSKLDKLVGATEAQINELRVLIAVGERILINAQEEYATEREEVLSEEPLDTLKLSSLLDFKASIRSFEVRLMRIKTAFVESASTAIRQIRLTQESISIEIQNIDEAILFDMMTLKRAILQLGALHNLKQARAVREGYDKSMSEVRDVLGETTQEAHAEATASQGAALSRAEDISNLVDKMITGAQTSFEADRKAGEQIAQAEELLIDTKLRMDDAMAELSQASA